MRYRGFGVGINQRIILIRNAMGDEMSSQVALLKLRVCFFGRIEVKLLGNVGSWLYVM